MDNNSNFALAKALKQAGVKLKAVVFATGYEPSVIKSPAWPICRVTTSSVPFRPFPLPNAGTGQMQAALEKYSHFTPEQFPTFVQYESWLGADLMIKGLQMAGKNPTRAAVIKDLRSIKSYNGNGLLPTPSTTRRSSGTTRRTASGSFERRRPASNCSRPIRSVGATSQGRPPFRADNGAGGTMAHSGMAQ